MARYEPMSRTSFYFVSFCMLLIAGSAGAIAYLTFRWGLSESFIISLSLMLVMVLGQTSSQRARDKAALDLKMADLSRVAADMLRQSDELTRRLDRIEAGVLDKAKAVAAPISAEVEQLGSIVKQFAETLQAHEQAIEEATHLAIQQQPLVLSAPAPLPVEPARPAASLVAATQTRTSRPVTGADADGPLGTMDLPEIATILRGAINDNRPISISSPSSHCPSARSAIMRRSPACAVLMAPSMPRLIIWSPPKPQA